MRTIPGLGERASIGAGRWLKSGIRSPMHGNGPRMVTEPPADNPSAYSGPFSLGAGTFSLCCVFRIFVKSMLNLSPA